MKLGTVKFYDEKKQFGFIKRPSEDDIFFHVSGVVPGLNPTKDMAVTFKVADGKKGEVAVNVDMQINVS